MNRLPGPIFHIAAAGLAALFCAQAAAGNYTALESAFDGGGGLVDSVHYAVRASIGIGLFGERAESNSGSKDDSGFIAQLDEAPVAGLDVLSRVPGQALRIPIATLLTNDFDFEGGALRLLSVDPVSVLGTPVVLEPGAVVFNPTSSAFGTDSFNYLVGDEAGGISQGLVVIMTGGPVLNARVSNGRAQFYFIGIPGRTYQVQVSDSLAPANWRGLGLVNATGEGLVQFTDPSAGGLSYRFYRAVQP